RLLKYFLINFRKTIDKDIPMYYDICIENNEGEKMTYTRQEIKQRRKGEMILAIKEIKGTEEAIKVNRKVKETYNTERDKTNWIRFAFNTSIRNNKLIVK